METRINVALLQIAAHGRDTEANLAKGLQACREAAASGAHIALFPEMWSIGYELEPTDDLHEHAIGPDHRFLTTFAQLAAELDLAIAVTFLQEWPDQPRNAVVVFDRQDRLGEHRGRELRDLRDAC